MSSDNSVLRFQANEKPPLTISFLLGLQLTALSISATILITTVTVRAGGLSEAYLSWAVFASVVIGGGITILQAFRFWRFGMGHLLMMCSSAVYIAVSIEALRMGGPATLATLVIVSALMQIVVSDRLSLFRRIFTPVVSGTVLMLLPVSILSPIFGMLQDVPQAGVQIGGPLSALVTVLIICGFTLKATGAIRLWAPVIGVVVGTLVAALFGLYDTTRVAEAPWVGLPALQFPGLDLRFGHIFWSLLPGFVFAAMIGSIRAISNAIAIQRVSWRQSRAIEFREVQGAIAADGLGNVLSGLAGTVPNSSISTGASMAQLTGVAARHVGIVAGTIFLSLAFLPKALAVMLAIPGPVFAAFLFVMIGILFIIGVQMIVQDGIDYRKGLIVGVSFLFGVAFQSGIVYPEIISKFAGGAFNNGMTVGASIAILMTLMMKVGGTHSKRLETIVELSSLSEISEFVQKFASSGGWNETMGDRLSAVCEEALLSLIEQESFKESVEQKLILLAKKDGKGVILEFITTSGEGENLEDRVALLSEQAEQHPIEENLSLRVLQHLSASVRHQKYSGVDIVTVRVDA